MKKVNRNLPSKKVPAMPKHLQTGYLRDFTTADLEKELEERRKPKIPQPFTDPDFSKVKAAVVEGINELREIGHEDEDFEHFVFEAAFEAVYGKDGWKWYNALPRQ